GTTVSWPLFDGFRTRGNLDVAKAQLRLAETELHQEQEAVDVEVSRARAELARSRSVFDARRDNAAQAAEAFRLATLRHANGLTEPVEVGRGVGGDILSVNARGGQRVTANEGLARFEPSGQESSQRSAEADRAAAASELTNAQWNLEKSDMLLKAGALSQRDY